MGNSTKGRPRCPRSFLWGTLLLIPVLIPLRFYRKVAGPLLHADLIERHATAAGFDPVFVMALVRVESGFSHQARSARGAVGLMQIMPETAREMADRLGLDFDVINLEDPDMNIQLGVKYLDVLRSEFGEDRVRLLCAYNAGPTHARSWGAGSPLTVEAIPFGETRQFVEKVLATERWLRRFRQWKRGLHV